MPRIIRRSRTWAVFLLAAALALPARAAAHAHLLATSPAMGATVSDSIGEIRLSFSEGVSPELSTLALAFGADTVARGPFTAVRGSDGKVVIFRLPQRLAPGVYWAVWRAQAADGHISNGRFKFTVVASSATAARVDTSTAAAASTAPAAGSETAAAGEEEQTSDADSPLNVAVRFAEFLALLGIVGAVAFTLLVVRRMRGDGTIAHVADQATDRAWRLAMGAAALSSVTLLARLWLQSVALNGADQAFDRDQLGALVTATVWGRGWILQGVATVALVVGLMVSRAPHGRSVGWMGAAVAALLLAAVPALSGHASAVEQAAGAAIVSDWLHVLGAGVWLGTLAAMLLAGLPAAAHAGEGHGTVTFARMVGAFSPVALLGAATAGVTGMVNSLFHFSAVHQLWSTPYGQTLLVKLALLAVVAGIGFYNWRYVQPSLHRSESPGRLRRTAGMELMMGVAVVLVTAVLVAMSPP